MMELYDKNFKEHLMAIFFSNLLQIALEIEHLKKEIRYIKEANSR